MTARKSSRRAALAYLVAPLTVLVVLFLAPLATMVRQSVSAAAGPGGSRGVTLGHYARFFSDSYYLSGLFITLGTAVLVTALTVVVSYPMAYTYWRASRRWRAALVILLLSPFYANVVVKVFGWMVVLARTGPVNSTLLQLGLVSAPIDFLNGYFAVVLVSVHRSLPFMVLLLAAALARIDPELLEAARVCGGNGRRVFRTVVLPLTIPGAIAGGILVFSLTVAAFVVPLLVGGGAAGRFLPVLMYQQITVAQNWAFGGAIGVVLLVTSMASIAVGDRAVRAAKLGRVVREGFGG
jgi:putative spermidine/putrescine transport system permease protein